MIHLKLSFLISLLLISAVLPQNWPTIGGNNQHNGLTEMTAPIDVSTTFWSISSSNSVFGNSIFTYGKKFVNSRVVFSPSYTAKVECRSLVDGALLWENNISDSSIMYCVGFNEFAVYAHDYKTDSLYALNPQNGTVIWSTSEYMFGGKSGVLFACNGDPVVLGRRLDKFSGQTIWQYNYIVPVGPDAGYAMFNDTYYHWSGSIVTPKKVFALDAETGIFKYESVELPGDGDQEIPLTIGADGTIYIARDGGLLYALEDDGNSLNIKWTYTPITSITGYLASSDDGYVYLVDGGKVRRIDAAHGTVTDSSQVSLVSGFLLKITVDADGKVIICNAEAGGGKYYCFSPDLQTLFWEMNVPYNYYCGASLGNEGVMVITGAGTQIKAYKYSGTRKPDADFYADTTFIYQGTEINFFDQSSYLPTSWLWSFPGAVTTSSTEQNPQNIVYESTGVYEVSLIATNALGVDTLVKSCYIEVEQVIPVELISFKAAVINNNVKLDWSTASETNNAGFEILRFTHPDTVWEKIGIIPGFGTTTESKTYSYLDENIMTGVYTYRLKQIDFLGLFTYSNKIDVDVDYSPKELILLQNYPNPFNPTTTLSWQQPGEGRVTIKVFDILGNVVKIILDEVMNSGFHQIEFDGELLPSGIYFYQISSRNFNQIKKMVLLR